jgi:hypothetical protein
MPAAGSCDDAALTTSRTLSVFYRRHFKPDFLRLQLNLCEIVRRRQSFKAISAIDSAKTKRNRNFYEIMRMQKEFYVYIIKASEKFTEKVIFI